jgi:hypothetical protein
VRIDRLFNLSVFAAFVLVAGIIAARADDQALVSEGEYLARAGDCIACHTEPGAALFAGGRPMATPFGTFIRPISLPIARPGLVPGLRTSFMGPCTPAAFPMAA